ncbi:nucleotide-binding protein [Nannocystis punicea]|uniref:Nucleotide-binding protein n=1 Tax=Nannocystis punicea TaxID=2995304 RepID=A0ABY7H3J2_9BACT|nr:nucleotide-binding protein [Nannocystis poenicansa]WAS93665.1 nucleotide-binding protein [Nannocystis poenicansa]
MDHCTHHWLAALGLAMTVSGCHESPQTPPATDRCAELDVPRLFVEKCSTAACHEGADPAAGLDLVGADLERRIVLQPATQCGGPIADPSDPESSVLIEKLRPDPGCGVAMPLGSEPLPEQDVQCIVEWISGLEYTPTEDNGSTSSGGEPETDTDTDAVPPPPTTCAPGETRECYSGLPETQGLGNCKAGVQSCLDDSSWGPCEGEVAPLGENCLTPEDENCDGATPACAETWAIGYQNVGNQQARAVAVDRTNDDVIVAGDFEGTVGLGDGVHASVNGKHDIFLARYDKFGNSLWTHVFGDSSNQYVGDVVVDAAGNIVLVGRAFGIVDFGGGPLDARGTDDIFVARFDGGGNHLWSTMVGGIDPERSERVAVDPAGNVYVTGTLTSDAIFGETEFMSRGLRDLFVMKLAGAGGDIEWVERIGGPGDDYGWGVAADDSGVYFTGYFSETVDFGGADLQAVGETDVIVGKYGPDGAPLWAHSAGGAGSDRGYDIALAGNGEVVITGAFSGALDFGGKTDQLASAGARDIFLARFTPEGAAVWAFGYGDELDQFENVYETNTWPGLAIGVDGTIFLAGSLAGAARFGDAGDTVSAGKSDVYLARFDASGNNLSARRWGGSGTEIALGVDADSAGHPLVVGRYFASKLDLDPAGELRGYGNSDGYIAKFPAL